MRQLTALVAAGIVGAALALFASPAFAIDHSNDPHWIKDFKGGCWLLNLFPTPGETAAWDGRACGADGEAQGYGAVTWFNASRTWTLVEQGSMVNGKMTGEWIRRWPGNRLQHSVWAEGQMQEIVDDTAAPRSARSGSPAPNGSSTSQAPAFDTDQAARVRREQNRQNCERAAKGALITCNPQ
ncbi:hypothetical protein BH11PSE2_BH11PSE2_21560 [soil metagenome]